MTVDTIVTFPSGALEADAVVTRAEIHPVGPIVVLDTTPFHPVDHTWPDQPGDVGVLSFGAVDADVVDTVMAAAGIDGVLLLGSDIPVRRGTEGWTWSVAHVLGTAALPAELVPGTAVRASVDVHRRGELSRGHTACHLASLALNAAIAALWTKDARHDALGVPDFDGAANQRSRITADGSVDEYRLGKTLRRSGVDTEVLLADLPSREAAINATLARWLSAGGAVRVEVDGPTIVDRRRWVAALADGTASIPCGGTHVDDLASFSAITVTLRSDEPSTLVMVTTAVPA